MVMRRGQVVEQLAAADLAGRRVQAAYTRSLMQASAGFVREAA
jgi:ABC-type dipeptide/oligopeptide/nickel transport system ATPase subunit